MHLAELPLPWPPDALPSGLVPGFPTPSLAFPPPSPSLPGGLASAPPAPPPPSPPPASSPPAPAAAPSSSPAPPPDAAERARLKSALEDLRRQCLRLARRRRELKVQLVAHNDIAALNGLLLRVAALNAAFRPHHRSARVSGWGVPPVPMERLLAPADLIDDLDAALGVLAQAGARP